MAINVGILEAILKLRDTMSPDLKIAARNLDQIESAVSSAGQSLLPFSAAIAGAGAASLAFSANFETVMTRLVSLAGVSQAELGKVRQHILDLAPVVGIGPQALAEAMTVVSSTVSDTNTALQILDTAAKGSAAGLGEAKDVAKALTAVINAYGAENITAARAADVLTKTVQLGGAEAKELAPTLANVVPIAAQLGISFEEVGANIATFTKLGVPAAQAVNSLRSIMSSLLQPTSEQADALASVGLTLADLRKKIKDEGLSAALVDLTQRFGENKEGLAQVVGRVEALTNIMGTAGQQAQTYADTMAEITKSAGTLDSAFDAMKGTQAKTWSDLVAQVQVVAIKFGDTLAPSIGKVVQAAQPLLDVVVDLVDWFGRLPQPVQSVAIGMGAVAAAAGPALLAIGTMAGAASTLATGLGMLAPAIGAVGSAAATAAAAFPPLTVVIVGLAAGGTIGTLIRDFTGLGQALDDFAVKSTKLTEVEAGAHANNLRVLAERKKATEDITKLTTEMNAALLAALKAGEKATAPKESVEFQKEAAKAAKEYAVALAAQLGPLQAAIGKIKAETTEKIAQIRLNKELSASEKDRLIAQAQGLAKVLVQNEQQKAILQGLNDVTKENVKWLEAQADARRKLGEMKTDSFVKDFLSNAKVGQEAKKWMADINTAGLGPMAKAFAEIDQRAAAMKAEIKDSVPNAAALKAEIDKTADAAKRAAAGALGIKGSLQAALANLPQVILGAIQGGGNVMKAVGASIGGALGTGVANQLGATLGKTLGATLGGAVGSAIPIVGTLLGQGLGSLIGGLFGPSEKSKVQKMRAEWIQAAGGLEELQRKAKAAKVPLDMLFNAQNVRAYEAAVGAIQGRLDAWEQGQQAVNDAMERWGLTVEQMGPKFASQKLSEQAVSLFKDWEVLRVSGADMLAVSEKMGPAIQDWYNQAIATGAAIPEAMRPAVEKWMEMGLLTDANGEKLKSLDGINFTQTLEEGLRQTLILLQDLIRTLGGVPTSLPGITIPVQPVYGAGGAGGANYGGAPPGYGGANGGAGYAPGAPTPGAPPNVNVGGTTVNVNIGGRQMAQEQYRLDRAGYTTVRG
jgi:TP901 family phage tail tape measure protein